MKLIDNAGQVWHRLWSLRFTLLASCLSAAGVVATMALPQHTSLRVAMGVGLLTLAASLASFYARLVKQPRLAAVASAAPVDADPARAAIVRSCAIADVRALMAAHGLTVEDVFGELDADH